MAAVHTTDEECAPHLFPPDPEGVLVQECGVCRVIHADACGLCDGRGFHRADCPELEG